MTALQSSSKRTKTECDNQAAAIELSRAQTKEFAKEFDERRTRVSKEIKKFLPDHFVGLQLNIHRKYKYKTCQSC